MRHIYTLLDRLRRMDRRIQAHRNALQVIRAQAAVIGALCERLEDRADELTFSHDSDCSIYDDNDMPCNCGNAAQAQSDREFVAYARLYVGDGR